jgi:flavin-dependent dehydrogenase
MDTENQFSEKSEINSGYDVIIIGAGPAGMLAAYELSMTHLLKILIVDMGQRYRKTPVSNEGSYLLHALYSV